MKLSLSVTNFRSIREQSVDVLPITVLYGPNGAGKSSLIYALLTLRNIVTNPNRNVNAFFSYSGLNLGSYEQVVRDHDSNSGIALRLSVNDKAKLSNTLAISGSSCLSTFEGEGGFLSKPFHCENFITFPYAGNQAVSAQVNTANALLTVMWNGVSFTAIQDMPSNFYDWNANELLSDLNAPIGWLESVAYAPPIRGFTKAQHSLVSLTTPWPASEDEMASLIFGDKHLVSRVSVQLEKMTNRDLRVSPVPGTGLFSLDTIDKSTGMHTELVNEGFGINQMAYLLAICLKDNSRLVCIEEPEIHLHTSSIRLFARALAEIARDTGKHFILTTHSETFVSSLLSMVAEGSLSPDNIACYLASKKGKESSFERQLVNEQGQISGGLSSFMEAEIENLRAYLPKSK
jgi:energy-coupling factor transporter ATP-binding protein EcfA2